ncbi:MAG: tryptophan--tRNA ligase [Deltaproteobacteria bacterium]|nr:tryptophan--tRNA ligase [Deltaproteobacteria bacterium]MBN2673573.1 tryptophan--tRNA ligase [Deltaproteobacteria bacterium]
MNQQTQRVFSGIQPSGDIHIGNYLGAVKKWVELTDTHDCIYCVVDDHAITVDYDVQELPRRTFEGVLTTMACGLDPDKCTIFVQSHVPEHTELTWLFNTITPLGSLFRMTQFKDKARNSLQRALDKKQGGARKTALFGLQKVGNKALKLTDKLKIDLSSIDPAASANLKGEELTELLQRVMRVNDMMGIVMQHLHVGLGVSDASCGLFDYPVLQAADILLYKASLVPVGEDQEQHLELCREVADRFNKKFRDTFPMVQRIKGEVPRIMGLDGAAKMSKSLNNYIGVLDTPETISNRLKPAFTDPGRIRKDDPGNPDICNIFSFHKMFSDANTCDEISAECRKGSIGCFDCKQRLADAISNELAPIRDRAEMLRAKPTLVLDALDAGRNKAGAIAKETMREVKDSMGIGVHALNKL